MAKIKSFKDLLIENKNNIAIFTFMRANPPTIGHQKVIDKIKLIAQEVSATPFVFLSHTQDKKKNPLSYQDKIKFTTAAFGDIIKQSNSKTIMEILKELNSYDNIIMVVGDDRVGPFEELINRYNDGSEGYQFDDIKVVSAGERDPDSDGIEGMSASKLRELAAQGNFKEFAGGTPTGLNNNLKKEMFDKIRQQLGAK